MRKPNGVMEGGSAGQTRERPILFTGPMVRAIMEGRKTQTRRVVKCPPHCQKALDAAFKPYYIDGTAGGVDGVEGWLFENKEKSLLTKLGCPYGQPGDRLWVRETFQPLWATDEPGDWKTGAGYRINYPATDGIVEWADQTEGDGELTDRCKPSIFMPRWASRLTLEITALRVERVQEISEADALVEGIDRELLKLCHVTPQNCYKKLWNDIHGVGAWDANPWVWVIEFQRLSNPPPA